MQRLRIALYSHDAMGLGHMRRNLLLANTLRRFPVRADVLLISGARELNAFPLPAGVDCVTLPGFSKVWRKHYVPRRLHMDQDNLAHMRARIIQTTLEEFEPHVLIVDKHPRGLLNELDLTLQALGGRRQSPRIVLGLRDILDEPDIVRREWLEAGTADALREFYDAIWIYGDPAVYNPLEEYGFAPDLAARVRFSGYLDPRLRYTTRARPDSETAAALAGAESVVLCQMGGGQDGARVAVTFAETCIPDGSVGVIVTGPFMPAEARSRIRRIAADRPEIRVLDFVSDPERLLQRAQRVITMGGYNSVCEVITADKRTLVVPRIAPRTEQLIRAKRMQELGLIEMLHPSMLSADALSRWLASGDSDRPVAARQSIDFNGLERLPRMVAETMSAPRFDGLELALAGSGASAQDMYNG
jgi:predicted glycosyltransferase